MIAENAIDWTIPWKEEGWREGWREGEAEGFRKGAATLLLRQLAQKYGPVSSDLEARVKSADAERLLDWGERFVDASSLDEIFDSVGD